MVITGMELMMLPAQKRPAVRQGRPKRVRCASHSCKGGVRGQRVRRGGPSEGDREAERGGVGGRGGQGGGVGGQGCV